MAAYSAVTVFRQTLDQLLDSAQFPPHVHKPQIESLREKVSSLQSSLDKISFVPKVKRDKMKDLQNRIREAIYAAQDEVEYWIKDDSPHKSDETTMKKLEDGIKLVEADATELEKEIRNDPTAQYLFSENAKDKIVGQEEDFKLVTEWLDSDDKSRLVIPITGLPGIGKTTLARSIYNDKETRRQFHIRAWVTVSQDVNYQVVFSNILSTMESNNYQAGHYATQGDEKTLLQRLHQELCNLKFLIVVDDIWDTNAWDRIAHALPDKENGSRILLTTRVQEVAEAVKKSSFLHEMKPLGLDHSWELLCYRVFGDKMERDGDVITTFCPPHLMETGKSIAEKCNGLPLSLVVVGSILIQKKVEIWKRVEEDIANAATKGEDSYLAILDLSYRYLPSINFSSKEKIVGQEEDFKLVKEWLESDDKSQLVIPITGIPGIGKTALARSIYEDKEIRKQFNIRAWVTVSQDVNYQEVFTKILNTMDSMYYPAGYYAMVGDEQTLLQRLHQELYNLKFLIVVDDVWDLTAWDRIAHALPGKENGSRILLTTRVRNVADKISKKANLLHEMQPLGLENSWELLCYMVFSDKVEDYKDDITKACPAHLKVTGRRIAENCNGIPLSIIAIAGLLSQERLDPKYWKKIEEDTAGATAAEDSYMENLSLSYNNLPARLKGCFLYMGAFPAGIRVSKLIKLWVAEGFFPKPSVPAPTLELVAQRALEDLVGRNLISVSRNSSNGGIKVCQIPNSLRKLAEIESGKEKFFHCRNKYNQQLEEGIEEQRRVSIHKNLLMSLEDVYETTKKITSARTLLYLGPHHHHPLPFCLTFDLLRVLDAFTVYFVDFPDEFFQLAHLTYLSLTYNHELPPEISLLQKLQVLMVRRIPKLIFVGVSFLPDEIWEMPELRHLWFTETDFPALPPNIPQDKALLLNLQTLANVDAAFFTDEILNNMPNLKKLVMWIEAPDKIGFNISKLSKLEHFKFTVLKPFLGKGIEVGVESFFPKRLKRITLSGTGLPWEYMEFLGKELKDLEVLKLKQLAFNGPEWCLGSNYDMKNLKYLLIEYLNFQKWDAKIRNFPELKMLIIRHCYELEYIPEDLGFSVRLEVFEVGDCSPQAVDSANTIAYRQWEGNFKKNFQCSLYGSRG